MEGMGVGARFSSWNTGTRGRVTAGGFRADRGGRGMDGVRGERRQGRGREGGPSLYLSSSSDGCTMISIAAAPPRQCDDEWVSCCVLCVQR